MTVQIGERLKAARTVKGQNLDAISQRTRIPRRWLEALEADRLDEFPAPAYLRGFLKGYCDFLDLDFDPLWKELTAPPQPEKSSQDSSPEPIAPAPKAAVSPWDLHAVALTWTLSLALTALLIFWFSRPENREPTRSTIPAALTPFLETSKTSLTIAARSEAWISVKINGTPRFTGLMPRFARQEWPDLNTASLKTAHPQALTITLNGRAATLSSPDEEGYYRIVNP